MAISYEEMTPSARATYDKLNRTRMVALKVGWLGVVLFVIVLSVTTIRLYINPEATVSTFMGALMSISVILVGILGIVHCKKMLISATSFGFSLPLGIIWGTMIFLMVLPFAMLAGFCFVYFDTKRYRSNKPLVYEFEHDGLMK